MLIKNSKLEALCPLAAFAGVLLIATLSNLLLSSSLQAAPPPIRIEPLGASLTKGTPVPGGYRTHLFQLLTNAGYAVEFVGTQTDNSSTLLPDNRHEGHSGFRIDHVDAGFIGWANAVPDPDFYLLLIGVNDFAQNQDLDHISNRLDHLISRITSNRPNSKLIVANLFKRTDYPDLNTRVQVTFNPAASNIVAQHARLGEQVYLVDLQDTLNPEDLSEGLHPNQVGYDKLAVKWFNAVTNLISPLGTTNLPAISRVTGDAKWTNLTVSFSKPVMADSTNLANFALSGGLKILSATLDPENQRDVTLTTTLQTPGTGYTVTVANVRDLTPSHRLIPPGTAAKFLSAPISGVINNVPEATNYTLVYSLNISDRANYNETGVPYDVDNHYAVRGFSRVAYYLELQSNSSAVQFVWVSMDAYTGEAAKIGVPTTTTGAFFQQYVTNLNVVSSMRGTTIGAHMSGGFLEFWPSAYIPNNAANLPNASSLLYDFGDQPTAGEYGSMQIHNVAAAQTIFAFNHWAGREASIMDLGIGNGVNANPDWTYAGNAANYSTKVLQVFVLPTRTTNGAAK